MRFAKIHYFFLLEGVKKRQSLLKEKIMYNSNFFFFFVGERNALFFSNKFGRDSQIFWPTNLV